VLWGVLLVAALIALPPVLVPLYNPCSRINYHARAINIRTGQQREQRYWWYIQTLERIEETPLSLALGGERVDATPGPEWHTVHLLSPYIEAHTRYHGALADASIFGDYAGMLHMDATRRRTIARAILQAWQRNGCDSGTYEIFSTLRQECNAME